MQPATERRLLVYQCGARSVVNVRDTRRCSRRSPSRVPPSESPAPFQGSRPREAAGIVGSTTTDADERSALGSPWSSLTVNTVTVPEGEWCGDATLFHTALSPSPRVPPPPPRAGCADHDVGDASGMPKNAGGQALSRQSAHHSLQGVSPSPFADDLNSHGDSAAVPDSDYHSSWFAEWPPAAAVASSSPALLLCNHGGAEALVLCAAASGVPRQWTSGAAVGNQEAMHAVTQPPLKLASTFQAGEVDAVCCTDAPQRASEERRGAVSALHACSRARSPPHVFTSNTGSGVTPVAAAGAERVLFDDDDDFTDISTASARCRTLQPGPEAAPAAHCAAVDAVAHTPPRHRDIRASPLLAPNRGGTGGCESTDCSSSGHFAVHYAATSVSSCATPNASVLSVVAAVGASGESLDAVVPRGCGPAKEGLTTQVIEDSAENSPAAAKAAQMEGTPRAPTTSAGTNGSLSAFKTPMTSPLRQGLFLRLLSTHAATATHTPTARPCSSGVLPPNAGSLATPTPLHRAHRWRGGNATPGWESLAEITGFPTPVKLSPIPTKGYSAYPELVATAAAAAGAATLTSTPRASGSPSPVVSAVQGDAHECDDGKLDAATPTAMANAFGAAEDARASRSQTAGVSFSEGGGVPPLSDGNIADYLSSAHSISTIGSECSVSPIRVRARQTTRVWTPHPSEVSQQQHPTPPPSSIEDQSSRFLSDFPSSAAVQPPPPQRQQPSVLRASPIFGAVHVFPCDHALSAHKSPPRTALHPERAAEEVSEDLTAMSLVVTEVQAQPSHQQPQKLFRPDAATGDLALLHRSADHSAGGWATPRCVADTLNLGTPTVSMIQSPAQALGESCCSLFMLPATQYIHTLPIRGLQRRNPPVAHAAQHAGLAVEGVGGESGRIAFANEARHNRRRQTQHPALMSPALSDGEEENCTPSSTVALCLAKPPPPRVQASPLVSLDASQSLEAEQPLFSKPEKAQCDASVQWGTSFTTFLWSRAVHQEPRRLDCSARRAPRCASSFARQLQRSSSSKGPATPPQAYQRPHLGLSSTKDTSRSVEVSYVRYRPTFTATSNSATRFIDSWL
ncbi:hypothetical protein LdCL_340027500 [Leishmania donovani]|uniref:Uncharacterized protein n=1 Tax=Leishmania donovani TaxID=5661 RepID=A0A3S7X7X9_LEIDO|nr:hypothetical protein LdCL_340027500 [Leishmania donovani]